MYLADYLKDFKTKLGLQEERKMRTFQKLVIYMLLGIGVGNLLN